MSEYSPAWHQRVLLAAGFLAFAISVLSAWAAPGRHYELDIYAATPTAFWLGVGMATLIGLFVAYHGAVTRRIRLAALALLGLSVFAVLGLPIVRNYYFYGPGDSLSHLGWARLIDEGSLSPFSIMYPGIHTTAVFVKSVLDVELTRAMQYVVLIFTAVFVVFVPLCVRELTDSRWAVVTGFVAALLLLPINNVSVFHLPYPTAQAIFFIPLVLYLAIKYVTLPDESFPRSVTSVGALLALTSLTIVVLHPQQASSVLLLFGGIVAVQFLYRLFKRDHPVSNQRPFYVQFAFVFLAFLAWTMRFDRSESAVQSFVNGLVGGTEAVGDEVTGRTTSLAILGGSIEELFVKIFLVAFVFSVIAGFVALLAVLGRLDDDPVQGTTLRYLSFGLGFLGVTFLLFFAASVSVYPFRYLGAIMVVVTILAIVGVLEGIPVSIPWGSWRTVQIVAVAVFGLFLSMQAAHVHESPYIYRSSDQVTKMTMTGYANTFDSRDSEVWFTGIDGGPRRYVDAIYGTSREDKRTPGGAVFEGYESAIPPAVFGNNVTEHYGRDRYVAVTDKDRTTQVGLYDGFEYSARGFRALETTPRIHR